MGLLPHGPFACKQVDSPYYPSESHEAARQAGLTCLGDGEPGFYLAGPPGAGKTTILRQILKHEAVAQEILVVNSAFPLSRKELIQSLLFDCQLPLGGTEVEVHLRLMDHLAGVLSTSCSIWVLVDDAGSLGADALGELFALTRITGKGGARLQVLMGGEENCESPGDSLAGFPKITVQPWQTAELADWIRQRIAAWKGTSIGSPTREWMRGLLPDGNGYPGQVLAILRSAWRQSGDQSVVYPDLEKIRQVREALAPAKDQPDRRESRRLVDSIPEMPLPVRQPAQSGLEYEGLEEWMAGSAPSFTSWEQGG
jgi:type II secretory pathway predicted ATPase ExeA